MMVYLFDGSFEGLLTCVFEAWLLKKSEVSIQSQEMYKPSFLDETRFIQTVPEKFHRVFDSIPQKISKYALQAIYRAYLSEDPSAPQSIYRFLRIGYKIGSRVVHYIQDPSVNAVMTLNKKVGGEAHRFLGLLRFQEIVPGVFYAVIEPDHNITGLIAPHFTERLTAQPFLIHDKKRNICACYDGQELVITNEVPHFPNNRTASEDEYAALWRTFFKTIAISERKNPRTQMQFMPKKYWKNLAEMQD